MHITEVSIETVRPADLRGFYADTLGQPVEPHGEGFTVTVGTSALTVAAADPGTAPVYHLAFTVPRNKLSLAKAWLAERTPLLTDADGRDEFRFDAWEATSVYFADPAGNILELIAWGALANDAHGPFGPTDLLAVSEVGLPVGDVPTTVTQLGEAGFAPYRDEWSPDFAPVGDALGRLIVVPVGRPWFPVDLPAVASPIAVTLRGDRSAMIPLPSGRIHITAAP